MKRTSLLMTFPFLFTICFAQKIVKNETDKFTKFKVIETNTNWVKRGLGCGLGFSYRASDTVLFISATGYSCAVGGIGINDKIIFLLDDGSTISAISKGIQTYSIGYGSGGNNDTYDHEYYITKDDIVKLSAHNLTSVRRYFSISDYADIDIKGKSSSLLKELSNIFLAAVNK